MEEIIGALTFEQAVMESAVGSPSEAAESEKQPRESEASTEVFSESENCGLFDPDEVLIEVDVEDERIKSERKRTTCTAGLVLPGTKRWRDM